ncbi:MAG: sigma-54-dependent Fis family transcriptional regulator [Gemmatimonadaceae bacterium]|nr:sigma-54-dependent Fis family transcriptional regulator [Gemmatimonadaceae bacterium]
MAKILCVDDDAAIRDVLVRALVRLGHEVRAVEGVVPALQALDAEPANLIITDWSMPGLDGLDLLQVLAERGDQTLVVMLTAFGSIEHAVAAIQAGAINYLTKPFSIGQLDTAVAQALEVARQRMQTAVLREGAAQSSDVHGIVGEGRAVRQLLGAVAAAASSRATVLLQGESGTGKELLARAIHRQSAEHAGPFIQVNCAAMPEGLIESTLFGHERGAFTGAHKRMLGAFERADGGTLLLDEVSEMRLDLQPKLLRVLQEREFERVGGTHPIKVNVRVIATSNRDLAAQASQGTFREDLFYRLSVFPIHVPPLRDRREDIPLLAYRFAVRAAARSGRRFEALSAGALDLLRAYQWPGNVRELEHAIERAVLLANGPMLEPHLFPGIRARTTTHGSAAAARAAGADARAGLGSPDGPPFYLPLASLDLAAVERQVIDHALILSGGNRSQAADRLGIDVRTLRRKLNTGSAERDLP